jgi:SAM-dependent methyltransferase
MLRTLFVFSIRSDSILSPQHKRVIIACAMFMPPAEFHSLDNDRTRWNETYRGEKAPRSLNENLMRLAHLLKPGRILDLAGGMGQNALWLTQQLPNSRAVVADLSDEALRQASPPLARVLCDASALPFARHSFDAILCTRFFDARVNFLDWLAPGGVVFFETYTQADAKYRPDFNPAHRFDLAAIPNYFAGLEILYQQETDDGHRVYVTIIARRT